MEVLPGSGRSSNSLRNGLLDFIQLRLAEHPCDVHLAHQLLNQRGEEVQFRSFRADVLVHRANFHFETLSTTQCPAISIEADNKEG